MDNIFSLCYILPIFIGSFLYLKPISMKKLSKYINGIMFGMLGEYIYRVEANIYAILGMIFIGLLILIDLFKEND